MFGNALANRRQSILFALLLTISSVAAQAGGPRWVSGPPYFSTAGQPIAWYTDHPFYFTDAGDLSPSVSHAAADALVAAAAATWNVPTSALVLAQGGSLDEHVTGAMVAGSGGTPVFPLDVQSTNFQAKQIAIIYDTDGSVIDALLGAGGSDPSGCLQTGVVESVDSFGTAGTIQHAVLILNGRCTGAAPEKQLQLQYQLMRAFGRVLGLGWSQTNDNVFTSSPTPTYTQALNWPIMHPIDVVCGTYTYQCMPQPFTLRADDLSELAQLYYVVKGQGTSLPGKEDSLARGSAIDGFVSFPNGQGMEGVNVTVRRRANYSAVVEDFQTVSSISGYAWRRQTGTPVAPQDGSPLSSIGTYDASAEGYWRMDRVPIPDANAWQSLVITTEPVNPLYTGPYALTTMAGGSMTIAESGTTVPRESDIEGRYYNWDRFQLTATNAVSDCHSANDGTEATPVTMAQSGWWSGVLCGYAHTSWTSMVVKANRSFTLEVTALDETGSASAVKAMPMVGVWKSSDALGVAPTVAVTPSVSFDGFGVGMTSLSVQSSLPAALRMVVVDQRGAGRPDFAYQARMLYADTVQPANLGANGGAIVITGTGFRVGNTVTVNGVAASVTNVTSTTISAVAPTLRALGMTKALLATVVVRDGATNGVTTMVGALGYGSPQERLQLVSAPTGIVTQGVPATTAVTVQVLGSDGVTPVANEAVTFAVVTGYANFLACGSSSCTLRTDTQGLATTAVTPTTAGSVTLRASTSTLSVTASFSVVAGHDTMTLLSAPIGLATVGAPATVAFSVRVVGGDGTTPRVGESVTVAVANATARLEACGASTCTLKTDVTGAVATAVTPLVSGSIAISATSAAGSLTSSFRAAAETLTLVSAPAGIVTAGVTAGTVFAVKVTGADGLTPVSGEAVVMTAIGGAVRFGACGGTTCTVLTDALGVAASPVTATATGPVKLSAAAKSGLAAAAFVVGAATMQVLSAPQGSTVVGTAASVAFAVRLLAADGVGPLPGLAVQFQTTSGSAVLSAGGATETTVWTDADGRAAITVTPWLQERWPLRQPQSREPQLQR